MSSSTMFNSQFKDSQTDENNNPKSKDCLLVKPSRELNFAHSKNRYSADLQLLNKKDEPVIYKIRTTAAKSYIVLPTIGVIPPRGVASIKIHMPTKEHTKERLTDKFLIQAFTYNGGDLGDDTRVMTQVFDQSYKTISPKELQNTKLRVYFESHTVIEEEMTEETASVRQQSPSTAMTRDVPESSSAFFASKPESRPSSAIKFSEQIKTVLSPEPEPMTRVENDDLFTRVLKDDKSDTLSEISNRNFRNLTPEPYVYHVYPDKSRVSEPEVLQMSQREEAVKVSRNLKSEFEKDAPKRNSLSNITNSLPRSFNSFNDNDVSIHTDISDVKSTLSLSEQLASYKQKLDLLERKYNEQNVQMARIMQEREAYQKEALNLRRGSASLSTTADETKLQPNNKTQMDVWHLIVLCIVCMILGSIFR